MSLPQRGLFQSLYPVGFPVFISWPFVYVLIVISHCLVVLFSLSLESRTEIVLILFIEVSQGLSVVNMIDTNKYLFNGQEA